MSIIIGVITKDNQLYIGSDKRANLANGSISDNYKKIYFLRPNLYFGMTGIAEYGLGIKNKIIGLNNFNNLSVSEIIENTNLLYTVNNLDSTIILTGRFEDKKSFIWNKSTDGLTRFIIYNGIDILYSINTNRNLDKFECRFKSVISEMNFDIKKAIKNTIEYASKVDDSISKGCEIIRI